MIDLHVFLGEKRVLGSHYAGIKSVSIDEIIGSEGKSEDFDRSFNARYDRTRTRWMNVAKARLVGRELPPVELIQVDNGYFVRDGHHRISVSRALGENYIDAGALFFFERPGGFSVLANIRFCLACGYT